MRRALGVLLAALAATAGAATAGAANADCRRADFAVAIDPGHTRAEPGATSARGVAERAFNESLSARVVAALRTAGFTRTFLTQAADDSASLWVIEDWPMLFAGSRPDACAASSKRSPISTLVRVVGWIEANVRFGPMSATRSPQEISRSTPSNSRRSPNAFR